MINKQVVLKKRPAGLPEADTWELQENPIPTIQDGEFLIENHFISMDPAMRGWLNDAKSYIPPVQIDEVMRAGSIGVVIESKSDVHKKGDVVTGWGGVQQYSVGQDKGYYKVDTSLAPMTTYISTLGMPGMTAYFGILQVGKIQEGETVVVSGAAGAVGSVVGQIAKIKGCQVIGIAGSDAKCKYVTDELGFDSCINYKEANMYKVLKEHCPEGLDVYFDNVGGEILDAALSRLKRHARIVVCGAISQYNSNQIQGPKNYLSLLVNRASMTGMVVMDYAKDYKSAAFEMGGWMMQGKLKSKEDVYEGIDNFYPTFLKLFNGDKMGKLVLKVK